MRLLCVAIFGTTSLFLSSTSAAHAALVVTEVMYNPAGSNTGHQWVEVTNTGPDAVDLGAKNIRLFDESGNHVIKAYADGGTSLVAGSAAVIAQNPLTFLNDYSSYTGILLKSSFSLAASAGIMGILQTDGGVLSRAAYSSSMGAAGDGNSLQRTSDNSDGALAAAAPTPGISPVTLPAALVAVPKVKQIAVSKSTNKGKKRQSETTSVTSKTYGKGTVAPPASADAAAGGALPMFPFQIPNLPVFSSVWFACFLGLLAFSSFSLILIQRTKYL